MRVSPALDVFLWRTTAWRHFRQSPVYSLGLIAVIALGIASFLSMRMATRAAVVSFSGFTETISGGSPLSVAAPVGELGADRLRTVRDALGTLPVHPVPMLQSHATVSGPFRERLPARHSGNFTVVGLDWIALQNLQPQIAPGETFIELSSGDDGAGGGLWERVRRPTGVYLSADLARRTEIEVGETLRAHFGETAAELEVLGFFPRSRAGQSLPESMMVMDLPNLQALTGLEGFVSRVDIFLPESVDPELSREAVEERLRNAADGRWIVRSNAEERMSGEKMTAAFRLNLAILSLIALLVGFYLIMQGLDAAVVRRRHEIAILRSLGLTKTELARLWVMEIFTLILAGSVVGILLGWGLAQFTVSGVAQTVNTLYFTSTVSAATLTGNDVLAGLALGLGAGMIAGIVPLKDALTTPPAQLLGSGNWRPPLQLLAKSWPGWCLIVLGCVFSVLPPVSLDGGGRFPLAGYVTAFCWLLGATFAGMPLLKVFANVLLRLGRSSPLCLLAGAALRRSNTRHRLAAAGLIVATAMAASMAILVGSFEKTVRNWIEVRFQADVYITGTGAQTADSRNRIQEATWRAVVASPGVAAADPFVSLPIELDGVSTFLAGSDFRLIGDQQNLLWLRRPSPEALLPPARPESREDFTIPAIANEAFVERFGLVLGTTVSVAGLSHPLRIVGIQADYGNEQGQILVDRSVIERELGIPTLTNLTLFLEPGTEPAAFIRELEGRFPGLSIRGNRELREAALRIFRQTFAVTHALEIIAIFIAIAGLLLALTNLLRESVATLRTLRQLGMQRREIARAAALEAAGITVTGLAAGFALSFALGYLLVHVINKQSFGWTLMFHIPWTHLALLATAIFAASVVTSYGCAYRLVGQLLQSSR